MNWLQSVIYGLVSGLTEFLPISSQAHQELLLFLFGTDGSDPVRSFFIHISVITALYMGLKPYLNQIKRERSHHHRRRISSIASQTLDDVLVVKNAIVPMIIGMLLFSYINNTDGSLLNLAFFLLLNGILIFLPDRIIRANKRAGNMSFLDSFLMGAVGALSVVPGFSRIGGIVSVSQIRGADRDKALTWAFLLSMPALAVLTLFDLFQMVAGNGIVPFWSNLWGYILSAAGAYVSAYGSIFLMKTINMRTSIAYFSFYSWSMSLLIFILYLTVV